MKGIALELTKLLQAFMLAFGAPALVVCAIADSFLPIPEVVDFCLMWLCIKRPDLVILYASATTLGSVIGCVILCYLARKAGHAAAERQIGKERMARIRHVFEKYEAFTILIPSILPPPVPFKAFVLTAGVVEVHWGRFILALTIGRAIRYFGEALLARHYGLWFWDYLKMNGPLVSSIVLVVILLGWLIVRVARRRNAIGTLNSKAAIL